MQDYFSQIEIARNEALKFYEGKAYLRKPLELGEILEGLGIKYHEEVMSDDVSGFLKMNTKDGRPVIVINANHSLKRRRFSVAHEIGHLRLHGAMENLYVNTHDGPYIFMRSKKASTGTDMLEIQANQFAAELLMPAFDVERRLNAYISRGIKLSTAIAQLAEFYQVSEEAMTIKVGKLVAEY